MSGHSLPTRDGGITGLKLEEAELNGEWWQVLWLLRCLWLHTDTQRGNTHTHTLSSIAVYFIDTKWQMTVTRWQSVPEIRHIHLLIFSWYLIYLLIIDHLIPLGACVHSEWWTDAHFWMQKWAEGPSTSSWNWNLSEIRQLIMVSYSFCQYSPMWLLKI